MARITLRAYNREIADLIEHDQFDQAIAHCKHILLFFSKHIDTYRLLGKAYLESQRFGDAADVFQRVLSSLPEDFIAHLGMSVIREDEGNIDEAIWHMERAFEMQPANTAVQGELRRLFGRRDGLEPPKIRLTRGALARMYVKGDLYPQAIAELRTALAEDPQRLDLLALLAHTYYLAGQKAEAAETSSSLLRKLPYSLEANLLLAQILAGSERAAEAENFRQRVQALDPYTAYTSPDDPSPDRAPETSVTVERLDWKPGQPVAGTGAQPEWAASLGVNTGEVTPQDSLPDWLANPGRAAGGPEAGLDETQRTNSQGDLPGAAADFNAGAFAAEPSEPMTQPPQGEIPDWMKDAGWETSSGQAEEAGPVPAFEQDSLEEEIAPAEIPDWLRSVAPAPVEDEAPDLTSAQEELPQASEPPQTGQPPKQFLPWLSETQPGPTDSIINWLEEKSPPQGTEESPGEAEEAEIPEWIQGLGEDKSSDLDYFTQEEADAPIDLPDWLTGSEPDNASDEIPDWLKSVADQPEAASGIKAVDPEAVDGNLEGASGAGDEEPAVEENQEWRAESGTLPTSSEIDAGAVTGDQPAEEIPDWLKATDQEASQSGGFPEGDSLELEPASEGNEEGAFDWLEGLADRQGAGAALFPAAEEPLEPGLD